MQLLVEPLGIEIMYQTPMIHVLEGKKMFIHSLFFSLIHLLKVGIK